MNKLLICSDASLFQLWISRSRYENLAARCGLDCLAPPVLFLLCSLQPAQNSLGELMAGKLVKHILTDLILQFFLCLFQLQWTFCFSFCHCHLCQGNVDAFPPSPSAAHTRIFLFTFLFFHLLQSLLYYFKRPLAGSSQSWLFQKISSLTSAFPLTHPELTPKNPEKSFPSTALSASAGCDHQPL